MGRDTGGVKYFFVEQETFQGLAELECARKDYLFMQKLL
jgi:hypothetical protein